MLLSIITVCLNSEAKIVPTIESIKKQTFKDYEYILIDGASSDNSVLVARRFVSEISKMSIFSEKDEGVYDAMNKGIQKAKGDYIYFLNAGDTLYNSNVLEKCAEYLRESYDICYGKIQTGRMIEGYPDKLTIFYLIFHEKMICHQAIFAKRRLLEEIRFNKEFLICADRDWLIKAIKNGASYKYMSQIIIADYEQFGLSSQFEKFKLESLQIAKEQGGIIAMIFVYIKHLFRMELLCIKKVERILFSIFNY